LAVDEQVLKDSMIRSLSRENEKFIKTCDNTYLNKLKNQIERLEKQSRENHSKYLQLQNAIYSVCDKYNLNYEEVRKIIRDSF
jgi:chaperonin cofactor prefoldin